MRERNKREEKRGIRKEEEGGKASLTPIRKCVDCPNSRDKISD
jgi:hypothetical protein